LDRLKIGQECPKPHGLCERDKGMVRRWGDREIGRRKNTEPDEEIKR
jgi:hypothetical protein